MFLKKRPVLKDFKAVYDSEFQGMTSDDVSYNDLVEVRSLLAGLVKKILTKEEKNFLISLKKGEPDWNLLGIDGIDKLPAVRWKLMNIRKMAKKKRLEFLKKLKDSLFMG